MIDNLSERSVATVNRIEPQSKKPCGFGFQHNSPRLNSVHGFHSSENDVSHSATPSLQLIFPTYFVFKANLQAIFLSSHRV